MDREQIIARLLTQPPDVTDPGSGLWRGDTFQVALARDITRILRTGEPLTIGLVGIDQPAPSAEDTAAVGAAIRRCIREVDLATSAGDGLFPLLLSRTGAELGHVAGERIRACVEEGSARRLTVSIGLASFPDDGLNREAIVHRVTDAFLAARAAGGNRSLYPERAARGGPEESGTILLVDDDVRNLKLLGAQLTPLGYRLLTAESGAAALTTLQAGGIDLVILDIMMPGMDGFEVCRRVKRTEATRQVPVILLTALDDSESHLRGIEAGADDFITKPANPVELMARVRSLVRVRRMNRELVSLENALISLANAVEAKDNYTLGHTQRVSTLAVAVGAKMGLADADLQALRLGGILHDVGKIGVPEAVLNKAGPLSDDEWALMKRHAELGYKICLPLMESIGPALDIIRHHHEKLDGSSYPDGLAGENVSVMARIMAVVDCYDAMITDRPYRAGMDAAKALSLLHDEVARGRLDARALGALEQLVVGRATA